MEQFIMLRSETDLLINEYGALLSDLLTAPAEQVENPGQHIIDESLTKVLKAYHDIKGRHQNKALSVALLALTKSGKSTFLNSLLGMECMPAGMVPETARICRIVHDSNLKEPVMHDTEGTYRGTAGVRERLHELNNEVRDREYCVNVEDILSIQAPLAALDGLPVMPTELHLLDTPGPNEAGEEGLKYQVERLLDGVGVLVYLLDCSKLKTAEEQRMFRRLKEINPQLLKRLSKRLFFLVNKKDVCDMTDMQVQTYVADLVTEQMESDFVLDPSQVMLISAKTALYSRMIMNGTANEEQRETFARLAFGQYGYEKATEEEILDAAPKLFSGSGIPEVEECILTFLYTHAGRLQMLAALDDVNRHLGQVRNTVLASEAALTKDHHELSEKIADMASQVERVSLRFEEINQNTNVVEADVTDEVRSRLQNLKERLFQQVDAVLCATQSPALQPKWYNLWAKVHQLLKQLDSTDSSSVKENEAQNRLADLYLSINQQMDEEVKAFWHELEQVTNQRQRDLFDVINTKLQELSGEVESVVMEKLDVRLEAANISMRAPDCAEHHEDLRKLFSQGIHTEEVVRTVTREVEDTVIEKHYSVPVCKLGAYYVAKPVKRTEVQQLVEMRCVVSPDKVRDFFFQHVEDMVTSSIRSVRLFVRKYLREQVVSAKDRLSTYCDNYQAIMGAALQEGAQSESDRLRALERVRHHALSVGQLSSRLHKLCREVEGAGHSEEGSPQTSDDEEYSEDIEAEIDLPAADSTEAETTAKSQPVAEDEAEADAVLETVVQHSVTPEEVLEVADEAVTTLEVEDLVEFAEPEDHEDSPAAALQAEATAHEAAAPEEDSKDSIDPEKAPSAEDQEQQAIHEADNGQALRDAADEEFHSAGEETQDFVPEDVKALPPIPTSDLLSEGHSTRAGSEAELVDMPPTESTEHLAEEELSVDVEYPSVDPLSPPTVSYPVVQDTCRESPAQVSVESLSMHEAAAGIQMLALPESLPTLSASAPVLSAAGNGSSRFDYAEAFLEPMSIREEPLAEVEADDFVVV